MTILPKNVLKGIASHKYKSAGYTPLDYIFYRYWWDPALSVIPLWVAPNMITLIGFIAAVSASMAIFIVNPSLGPECPVWATIVCGVSFAFYTMMDAIDGRQARRTNSSSPLGQLFDHGCDCILAGFLPMLVANALGMGTYYIPLLVSAAQILFSSAMWEEKYVGECRTTVFGLIGTSEILSLFIGLQLLSGTVLSRGEDSVGTVFVLGILFSSVVGSAVCLINVLKKTRSLSPLKDLVPILAINGGFQLVPTISSAVPFLSLSLTNSLLTILMIVASMGKSSFPPVGVWGFICALVAAEAAASLLPHLSSTILNAYTILFGLYFLRTVVTIIGELKQFLGISVLTLNPRKTS